MQKIKPCLWFDDRAEEAVNFYVSVFKKDSEILNVSRYSEEGAKVSGRPNGSVMTVDFRIYGQEYLALNGGPMFTFSEAISFIINCENQDEVDELWEKLSEGGSKSRCGWLKDKFGLSWQIVPDALRMLMQSKDHERTKRVMAALFKMDKIDIKTLQAAYGD
ncbi:MAG TPA: VOC family protein [Ignavibacteria bacterium]|nr:VOC family protein [Ignavibacteria bacterium]